MYTRSYTHIHTIEHIKHNTVHRLQSTTHNDTPHTKHITHSTTHNVQLTKKHTRAYTHLHA